MKLLLKSAKRYVDDMDIVDVALLKVCLCAVGVLIGIGVSDNKKRAVGIAAVIAFLATYIPLMSKLADIIEKERNEEKYSIDEDCFEIID